MLLSTRLGSSRGGIYIVPERVRAKGEIESVTRASAYRCPIERSEVLTRAMPPRDGDGIAFPRSTATVGWGRGDPARVPCYGTRALPMPYGSRYTAFGWRVHIEPPHILGVP